MDSRSLHKKSGTKPMLELEGRRALVMGLGLFGGGVGLTRYLVRRGARVTVTDLREAEELAPSLALLKGVEVEYHLGVHREEDFRSAEVVFVNPAVPKSSPYLAFAREAGAELSSEIALFVERFRGTVLAVTGSNGKTTTAGMLGAMVSRHIPGALVGGNMGVCLLDRVDDAPPGLPAVLELSSFQLEDLGEVGWSPHIAVVTNLVPNHLDRHGTFAAYVEAKSHILRHQSARDAAVLNAEDPQTARMAELTAGSLLWFGLEGGEGVNFYRERRSAEDGGRLTARFGGAEIRFFELADFTPRGEHNVANALAASAAAYAFGVPLRLAAEALARFRPIAHRLEEVGVVNGVAYYNDSVATTPESTIAALKSFTEPVWLIAGGYDKGASFELLGREIALRAKGCLVMGATAGAIEHAVGRGLEEVGRDFLRPSLETVEVCGDLEAAVSRAA
ncbi:MAG TPA: UDP-N-acetylmuramoyl-L-alanine--D-glutamate ligase, partial [Candidatus Coatesbacteria bacterium]|nr:UDP-N-acetylmuramoyl-L-alanine--D-glutamate ligase [Candidatus Coatesbacteria bacterium]